MHRRFRPEIQMLRALAVVTVVIYHINPDFLPGGFVGVDVFFVISGFLITAHMLREAERTQTVNLLTFWANRARRILPAATVAIVVTALASLYFLPRSSLSQAAIEGLSSAFYVQNWALAINSVDYLGAQNSPSPFQHFWSLSIEEQFYIMWPLVVILAVWIAGRAVARHSRGAVPGVMRKIGTAGAHHVSPEQQFHRTFRVVVGVLFAIIILVSFVWSAVLVGSGDPTAYFVTQSRIWELGAGGLLAVVMVDTDRFPRLRTAMALVGIAAILVACIFYTGTTPAFPGVSAFLPVLGTMAVIAAGRTQGLGSLTPIVDLRAVQKIGNWSYSLYLWHFPLVVFFTAQFERHANTIEGTGLLVFALALAYLSFNFVEEPLRRNEMFKKRRWLTVEAAAVSMVVAAAVALVPQWAVNREYERVPEAQEKYDTVADDQATQEPEDGEPLFGARAISDPLEALDLPMHAEGQKDYFPKAVDLIEDRPKFPDECDPYPNKRESDTIRGCTVLNPDGSKELAVVGDSHAAQWVPALEKALEGTDWKLQVYAKNACGLNTTPRNYKNEGLNCVEPVKKLVKHLVDEKPDKVLIANLDVDDYDVEAAEEEGLAESDVVGYDGYIETLKPLKDAGIDIVAFGDTPVPPFNMADCMGLNEADPAECNFKREDPKPNGADLALKKAAEDLDIRRWDPTPYFCGQSTTCPAVVGSVVVYRDQDHISASYSETLADYVAKALTIDKDKK